MKVDTTIQDPARIAALIKHSLEGMYEPISHICGLNSMYTPPHVGTWLEHRSQWPLIAASTEWPARWRLAAQQCLDGADPYEVLQLKAWHMSALWAAGFGMADIGRM
jgi:hypothetical protein